jgi:uncharacterized protein DUF6502
MNPKATSPGEPPSSLVSALRRILRPLIRLLLSEGVTYPYLAELLKSVYVDVANQDFKLDNKRQTDSRISLLTGVHRKDVRRLGRPSADAVPVPPSISLGGQLVARWISQDPYRDSRRRPIALPRLASDGGARSFEALVESVSKDIRPRAVLDEWLRLGVAHIDERDRVCLNVEAFIPEKGLEEKAYYFGQNLHDHMAAAVHNLLGQLPPFMERSVYYDQLSRTSVAELAKLAEELGMRALQTVNQRAAALERRDAKGNEATMRMNFGIYYFSASQTDQAEPGHRADD